MSIGGRRGCVRSSVRTATLGGLMLLAACVVAGCKEQAAPEPEKLTSVAERGPFKFTLEAWPKQIWIGDEISLVLQATTPDDALVEFPSVEDMGDLEVLNVEDSDPRPGVDGGLVWRRRITATAYASGVVEIPSLAIKYATHPESDAGEPSFDHELNSEALQVEALSALTSQDSVTAPRDITAALTPPRAPLSPWAWGGLIGGGLLMAALIAWLVVLARRIAARPAPPVPPEIWALRQLSLLEAERLVQQWLPKQFYFGLSEIVRVYIERQFSLAAPEMTTEEFLGALAADRGALPYDAGILGEFLEACDLVKYAALEPLPDDGQNALGIARAFIDTTAAAASRSVEREERAA